LRKTLKDAEALITATEKMLKPFTRESVFMQRLMLWLFIVTIFPVNVWAQEVAATWQGKMLQGTGESRVVLQLTKSGSNLSGRTYVFSDRGAEPYSVSNVSVNGVNLSYSIEMLGSH